MSDGERRSSRELELEDTIAILKKQLVTDELTGAVNTRGYRDEIGKLKELAAKGILERAALICADIDDFKKYNDTYGHDFGDEVLKIVAATMQASGRKTDTVFRFGEQSDEMALLLAGADEGVGNRTMKKINNSLVNTPVKHSGAEVRVTVTMAIATFPQTKLEDLKSVADEELIARKKTKGVGR